MCLRVSDGEGPVAFAVECLQVAAAVVPKIWVKGFKHELHEVPDPQRRKTRNRALRRIDRQARVRMPFTGGLAVEVEPDGGRHGYRMAGASYGIVYYVEDGLKCN